MSTKPVCKHCGLEVRPCRCIMCGTPGWRHRHTMMHRCGPDGLGEHFAEPES